MKNTLERAVSVKIIDPRPFWLGGKNYVAERRQPTRPRKEGRNVRNIMKSNIGMNYQR